MSAQDLSVAGLQKGMKKGSGTRSGLLWEVERLLNECEELSKDGIHGLPNILLMENVTQCHGTKNYTDFYSWVHFLESKGYSNFIKDMNAKNYGIPQNRDRSFMVSILGDWDYEFPEPIELQTVMLDYMEDEVDDRYYINTERSKELLQQLIVKGELDEYLTEEELEQYLSEFQSALVSGGGEHR